MPVRPLHGRGEKSGTDGVLCAARGKLDAAFGVKRNVQINRNRLDTARRGGSNSPSYILASSSGKMEAMRTLTRSGRPAAI